MSAAPTTPVYLGKWRALPFLAGFATDSVAMSRRLYEAHGPFAMLEYPVSTKRKPAHLGFAATASLYREILTAPDVWRNVNILFRGVRGNAADRLSLGMTRLRGKRHEHYRRLISGPLKRPPVVAMSPAMAAIALDSVADWPRDKAIDLLPLTELLMKRLAIGILFGDDIKRAMPVADMIARQIQAAHPAPSLSYLRWLPIAARQEKAIMDWAAQKRGDLDPRDILSVLVNNADENGAPPNMQLIAAIVSFTFGAAYETCQNALIWTLVALSQHPEIAARLGEEVSGALRGAPPTMDLIERLALLDGVVREGLRLFPPVPLHFRRSTVDTTLGGAPIPKGTRVLLGAWLINRNPAIYPDPDRFRPDRWSTIAPTAFDFATFAAGAHMCPGATFAYQMMKIALSAIVTRFRVEMQPNARIDYRTRITMAPYPGVPAVLRDVSAAPVAKPIAGGVHRLVDLPRAA